MPGSGPWSCLLRDLGNHRPGLPFCPFRD
jgi:hypothetical protein